MTIWRASRLCLARWSCFRRRALIVGAGSASEVIWKAIKQEVQRDYEIAGYVTSAQEHPDLANQTDLLGVGKELIDTPLGYIQGILRLRLPQRAALTPDGSARPATCLTQRCGPDAGSFHSPGSYAMGIDSLSLWEQHRGRITQIAL